MFVALRELSSLCVYFTKFVVLPYIYVNLQLYAITTTSKQQSGTQHVIIILQTWLSGASKQQFKGNSKPRHTNILIISATKCLETFASLTFGWIQNNFTWSMQTQWWEWWERHREYSQPQCQPWSQLNLDVHRLYNSHTVQLSVSQHTHYLTWGTLVLDRLLHSCLMFMQCNKFTPVHLHHWLSAAPDSLLLVTELSRSPLHVSGTVCQILSLPHLL